MGRPRKRFCGRDEAEAIAVMRGAIEKMSRAEPISDDERALLIAAWDSARESYGADEGPAVDFAAGENQFRGHHAIAILENGVEQVFSAEKAVKNHNRSKSQVLARRVKEALRKEVKPQMLKVKSQGVLDICSGVAVCDICKSMIENCDLNAFDVHHSGSRGHAFKDLSGDWMELEGLTIQTLKLKEAERQEGNLIEDASLSQSWRTYHMRQSVLRTVHRRCHRKEPRGRRKLPGED